jgi:hypothetical protein
MARLLTWESKTTVSLLKKILQLLPKQIAMISIRLELDIKHMEIDKVWSENRSRTRVPILNSLSCFFFCQGYYQLLDTLLSIYVIGVHLWKESLINHSNRFQSPKKIKCTTVNIQFCLTHHMFPEYWTWCFLDWEVRSSMCHFSSI